MSSKVSVKEPKASTQHGFRSKDAVPPEAMVYAMIMMYGGMFALPGAPVRSDRKGAPSPKR